MESDRIIGLFRFASRPYVDDFLSGILYMNTLGHFAKVEVDETRRDLQEGNSFWLRGEGAVLQLESEGRFNSVASLIGPIAYSDPDELNTNVFCLHALLERAASKPIDSRVLKFGDTFAALLDPDEFVRRVRVAAQKVGFRAECRLVEYVDKATYQGKMGAFKKVSDFSYQSEYRVALFPGTGSAYRLDVGDLTDLTLSGPTADLNRRIRVEG